LRSLRSIRPGTITVERQSAITGALLFSPVILAIMALPWLEAPTSPWGMVVTTLTGLGWLLGVSWLTLRRPRLTMAVSPSSELVLEDSSEGDDSAYRVLLADGDHVQTVLEHEDPARALVELRQLRDELRLPVRPGWGLSASALRHADDGGAATLSPADVSGQRWQAQRRTALASCLGSLFILGVTVFTFVRVNAPATTLGQVLPILFAVLLALVGLSLFVLRVRVRVSARGLRVDTTLLYLTFEGFELPAREIGRADAVGARADRPQHVLIHTSGGPRAIPLVGAAAHVIARAIATPPPRSQDSAVPWTPITHDRARSLQENPC
jgi:hypothetical protein